MEDDLHKNLAFRSLRDATHYVNPIFLPVEQGKWCFHNGYIIFFLNRDHHIYIYLHYWQNWVNDHFLSRMTNSFHTFLLSDNIYEVLSHWLSTDVHIWLRVGYISTKGKWSVCLACLVCCQLGPWSSLTSLTSFLAATVLPLTSNTLGPYCTCPACAKMPSLWSLH